LVGFFLGAALTALVADFKHIEETVLIGIPAVGFIVWLWRRRRAATPRVRP
jgi:membrane protein DedA with SNARE-associated domain